MLIYHDLSTQPIDFINIRKIPSQPLNENMRASGLAAGIESDNPKSIFRRQAYQNIQHHRKTSTFYNALFHLLKSFPLHLIENIEKT
jgi:hypothetical protein